jgi:hypothetical protein
MSTRIGEFGLWTSNPEQILRISKKLPVQELPLNFKQLRGAFPKEIEK